MTDQCKTAAAAAAASDSSAKASAAKLQGVRQEVSASEARVHAFYNMRRRGLRAVIAHPERYETVWKDREVLEPLLDAGAVLQLDVASLVGKYGRAPQRAAEALLEEGWYTLAASDAHKPKDVDEVARAIERIAELAGEDEVDFLLREGPRAVLEGRLDEL
jgi:protein-tyrosine phosphatase